MSSSSSGEDEEDDDSSIDKVRNLRRTGHTARVLLRDHTSQVLVKAGFPPEELRKAGLDAAHLSRYFSGKDLREAGFTIYGLKAAGFQMKARTLLLHNPAPYRASTLPRKHPPL
jgi:ribosomal protein L13E